MFVVLEGIDNSGKTYQTKAIKAELEREGVRAIIRKEFFPKIFEMLKRRYDKGMFSPFVEAMISGVIAMFGVSEAGITDADVVIIDRFVHTVLAYGEADNRSVDIIDDLDRSELYDLAIYIDITPEEAMERSRRGDDNMRYSRDYLSVVREHYLGFVDKGELIFVDGMRPRETVTREIMELLQQDDTLSISNKVNIESSMNPIIYDKNTS